jgi:hypothetical protein
LWRVSFIPTILTNHGLSSDDPTKAQAFQVSFFGNQPPIVPEAFPDDPPALEARNFSPITHEEIASALSGASNKSAPGPSGQGCILVKWIFAARPERLVHLLNASLRVGHPHPWREATAVVTSKPNRTESSLPKELPPHLPSGMPGQTPREDHLSTPTF